MTEGVGNVKGEHGGTEREGEGGGGETDRERERESDR